jgi:hypothetical protein
LKTEKYFDQKFLSFVCFKRGIFLPWYRKRGKLVIQKEESEFLNGVETGKFVKDLHRAFAVLIYFAAIRKGEALRVTHEQFKINDDEIVFDVGPRLKQGIQTSPLKISRLPNT